MSGKDTRWDETVAWAEQNGFTVAGPDHPVYSEGPSIMFVHHRPEQSVQKHADSHRKSSPKDSD